MWHGVGGYCDNMSAFFILNLYDFLSNSQVTQLRAGPKERKAFRRLFQGYTFILCFYKLLKTDVLIYFRPGNKLATPNRALGCELTHPPRCGLYCYNPRYRQPRESLHLEL
jgi:hypothetical protein